MTNACGAMLLLAATLGAGGHARPALAAAPRLADAVAARHGELVQRLSAEERQALAGVAPDYRVIALCRPGGAADEVVVGLWRPFESPREWERIVDAVGLVKTKGGWAVHRIDAEIADDARQTNSSGVHWEYTLDKLGLVVVALKCGAGSEFGKDSDLTYALGDRPLFDLDALGSKKDKVTCLATDYVYNNWDCVVYSPRDGRYRLWFRQAHAD